VFRSRRREVVFPQREHARLSAALADAWSDVFAPVRLPRERFVRGVAEHDRGYAEHDVDEIGQVSRDRWLAIQERGFAPTGEDPVVDLVVALHVRRLVSGSDDDGSRRVLIAMEDALPALVREAGASDDDAAAADRITHLCDRISFDFCLEEPDSGAVDVLDADGTPVRVAYAVDGRGTIALDPWPLDRPALGGAVLAYAAEGYPDVLEEAPTPFAVEPMGEARR
jgi:hypothetical protein